MRVVLILVLFLFTVQSVQSQNTDLPVPVSNIQTLPTGSYVIAMDNTNQLNNSSVFNLKAYGLIVTLLNNSKKVKWVIKSGKVKDSSDFNVNATRIRPTLGSAASFYFKSGPFVIFAADTTGVSAIVVTFNSAISNANDKVKVYQTNADVSVDIRYDLSGFVPKGAILNDGGNQNIHTGYMTACNIPSGNYQVVAGSDLLLKCYTFACEPHNSKTGQAVDDCIAAVKRFTQYGGNFLAQCHAILTFENSTLGHFLSTTGITDAGSGAATNITYPNPDLAFSQFEGNFDISIGGSLQNWKINAAMTNSGHKHSKANADTTVIGTSVAKMRGGKGGLVFYIGNHNFDHLTTVTEINGIRMFMNAFLTPAGLGNCNIGDAYAWPLAIKLISFQGALADSKVNLSWKVGTNENISKFIVEKSTDGVNYSAAFERIASGIAGEANYGYTDPMTTDKVFYRLRIVEKAGVATYSSILIFQSAIDPNSKIRILNNPVTNDQLVFSYNNTANMPVEVRVVDMAGRVQYKQTLQSNGGSKATSTSLLLPSALPAGMYILDLVSGSTHSTAKFIVQ